MRLRAYLAEFLGTGLITATVVGSGIMAQTLTRDVLLQLFVNTFATVMALALAIWLLAPVSGAYFNPAVVFIAFLRKKESLVTAVTFSVIQIVGAVGGAILEKLSVRERPSVIAGLAKLVDDVNTYALPIHKGTNQKACSPRP